MCVHCVLQYAGLLTALMVGQLVFGGWLAAQALAWSRSAAAAQMQEALALTEHLRPVLQYLARWHPLPHRIEAIIEVRLSCPCLLE